MSPRWNDQVEALAANGVGKQRGADRPGRKLRAIRTERGISRAEVARASGFSVREIAKVERNGSQLLFEDWRALAGAVGVDVGELAPPAAKPADASGVESEDPDDVPLDLVDLELDEFMARVRGDISGNDSVMTAALAELDTDATRRSARHQPGREHRRGMLRSSKEFRLCLSELGDLCTQFVGAPEHDRQTALATEIAVAVERVRSCREFREVAVTQPRRR